MSVCDARSQLGAASERLMNLRYCLDQAWMQCESGTWAHDVIFETSLVVEAIDLGEDEEADEHLKALERIVDA